MRHHKMLTEIVRQLDLIDDEDMLFQQDGEPAMQLIKQLCYCRPCFWCSQFSG